MIPFFELNTIALGPITIQVWGLMVACGIIAATLLMNTLAKKYLLSQEIILDLSIWGVVGGFIFARVFHVLFYNLDFYLANPFEVFKIWHGGASSFGGFFGAGLAMYLFSKKRHLSWSDLVPYLDIASVGLWLGWGVGRVGCFLIHDHPGTLSHFLLSVKFPGGARLDLGLLESLLGFVLFAVFMLLLPRLVKKRWGLAAGFSFGVYAATRFFLDFLRASDLPGSDIRYAYLTPAQWGMLFIIVALTLLFVSGKMSRSKHMS